MVKHWSASPHGIVRITIPGSPTYITTPSVTLPHYITRLSISCQLYLNYHFFALNELSFILSIVVQSCFFSMICLHRAAKSNNCNEN